MNEEMDVNKDAAIVEQSKKVKEVQSPVKSAINKQRNR